MIKHLPWNQDQELPPPGTLNQTLRSQGYGVAAFPLAPLQNIPLATAEYNEMIWLVRGEVKLASFTGESCTLKPGDRVELAKGTKYSLNTESPTGAYYLLGRK